jgi:hypothetical protein
MRVLLLRVKFHIRKNPLVTVDVGPLEMLADFAPHFDQAFLLGRCFERWKVLGHPRAPIQIEQPSKDKVGVQQAMSSASFSDELVKGTLNLAELTFENVDK